MSFIGQGKIIDEKFFVACKTNFVPADLLTNCVPVAILCEPIQHLEVGVPYFVIIFLHDEVQIDDFVLSKVSRVS